MGKRQTNPEPTMTEYHAIKKTSPRDGGRFFEWKGESFFSSRAALETAISEWKATVTPRMVETATFEIHEVVL
jgi:hypothetical protein